MHAVQWRAAFLGSPFSTAQHLTFKRPSQEAVATGVTTRCKQRTLVSMCKIWSNCSSRAWTTSECSAAELERHDGVSLAGLFGLGHTHTSESEHPPQLQESCRGQRDSDGLQVRGCGSKNCIFKFRRGPGFSVKPKSRVKVSAGCSLFSHSLPRKLIFPQIKY